MVTVTLGMVKAMHRDTTHASPVRLALRLRTERQAPAVKTPVHAANSARRAEIEVGRGESERLTARGTGSP